MRILILSILALSGCNTPPSTDGPSENVSGERLRARYLISEDGAREFLGWFDNELGVPCQFWVAPSGDTRCYPAVIPSYLFAESDCTAPVGAYYQLCDTPIPEYISSNDAPECDASALRPRMAQLDQQSYYRASPDGTCQPEPPAPDTVYYLAGDPLPPTYFAGALEVVD